MPVNAQAWRPIPLTAYDVPLQAVGFLLLSHISDFASLAVLAFMILLCYGGGLGTTPAFAADYFAANDIGSIYA
jgi:OFA family oxalate/formate antiporter-like MFS transporter